MNQDEPENEELEEELRAASEELDKVSYWLSPKPYTTPNDAKYTYEELAYLLRRAMQRATDQHYGIPPEEEGLSSEEIASVIAELEHATDWRMQSDLIDILEYAGYYDLESSKRALASFFDGPSGWLAFKVIQVFRAWELLAEYTPQLSALIRGVPGDSGGFARVAALAFADEYLRDHSNPTLLGAIIELFESDELARSDTLNALYNIFGRPDVPDTVILQMAEERLAKEETR